jgi:two-component system response regulator MprA
LPPAPVRPKVVLLVEDDQPTRELYRSVLHNVGGYSVVAVRDGVEAIRYLDVYRPDVVVLDLGLPSLSGRDVLAEMSARGLTQTIPVVIATGQDPTGLKAGTYACVLPKPVNTDDLLSVVRKCLGRLTGHTTTAF